VPHAQPISFFSILSPAQYWVKSINHLAVCPYRQYLVHRLHSKNYNLPLPAVYFITSPVEELQFSPNYCVCYTVSIPRTAECPYRLYILYRLQSKNCSFHLLTVFTTPSPFQEPQSALTDCIFYTVFSPRIAVFTYLMCLLHHLHSKNHRLPLPTVYFIPSSVQELQFSSTYCVCYTVSIPRTTECPYRLYILYRLQSKNCSFHLLTVFAIPSPFQEPQSALTDCIFYTVFSPRIAVFTYLLCLLYRLHSKKHRVPLPTIYFIPSPIQDLQFSPTGSF